ncbi:hypothetical protein [Pseudomonas sp. FSL R10-0765]|nr:hypothetical protein [Pseudomonas sp. FSL R10-0765]MQT54520.1 hypothetical protein [Pseudomonas sp. FSL R10-2398]MQU01050.1 hypothetical protein [Pseudomonas sp. FSL R10-2245]MQU11140.1 hypothetical protein [Pseudomonas sp. FSL R10-2189]MQU40328.1 hypothetical protein [Pseudomonas sp. FSL R10-2172]
MSSLSPRVSSTASVRYLVLLVASALLIMTLMGGLSWFYSASAAGYWPGYADMLGDWPSPLAWLRWVIGDISEVAFYKHEFASLGLLLGGALGYWASRYAKTWQGFSISYGTGLWPWLVTSSLLGLALSNALWGWTLTADTWQPTFAAFVSLPAAMVLLFGGGWKVTLNGAVLGALLVTPCCLLIVNFVCLPLGLPVVIGNVLGMALGSALAFGLCRCVPVLVKSQVETVVEKPAARPKPDYGVIWTLRRVLADFSEAPFFGNEWASLGMLAGVLLAYALNPLSPAYGSGLLLHLVAAQAFTSLLGVIVWRSQWQKLGWYPTYVPLVSVVPAAVLTYGASATVMIASAVLGALVAPPLANAIARRLPQYMHPYIGNVLSMAISTLLIVPVIGYFIP